MPSHASAVNRILVTAFLDLNNLDVKNNSFIQELTISQEDSDWEEYQLFKKYFLIYQQFFAFEDIIEIFELVLSPADKKVNGAVYTPNYIKDFIIEKVAVLIPESLETATVCDVACGCGGFLYSYAQFIRKKYRVTYAYVFRELIYGVDIAFYSVVRSKITLSLLALYEGEDDEFDFNIVEGNSLDFDWRKRFPEIGGRGGFDAVIGNPPYVCAKNLSVETRDLLSKWPVALSGNPDLYIPFFQIGLDALRSTGVLGYITVNTFIKSVNGRHLRDYFFRNQFGLTIIDFGGEQVFKGRTTYTCICLIERKPSANVKYYLTESKYLQKISEDNYLQIPYRSLTHKKGWNLSDGPVSVALNCLRNSGKQLTDLIDIKGGFATLKNSVFVFKPHEITSRYYVIKSKDGRLYNIEKELCRNAIKAGGLKKEEDLESLMEKIIFPYYDVQSPVTLFENDERVKENYKLGVVSKSPAVMSEDFLSKKYPSAYAYLQDCKGILATRDKGAGEYDAWYAFGRSQGLNTQGYRLLFPHISDRPYFVYTEERLLFYSGFSIVSWDKSILRLLQKILSSDVFWFFVKHSSKPYAGNFYGLGKNFIRDFTIPDLSATEKHFILNCEDSIKLNRWLMKKYNIPSASVPFISGSSGSNVSLVDSSHTNKPHRNTRIVKSDVL